MQAYVDSAINEYSWFRTFDPSVVDSEEYVWHRDLNDRVATVIEGYGWSFQFDNELPFVINTCSRIIIPKMEYHRLLPGKTPLKIKIEEAQ